MRTDGLKLTTAVHIMPTTEVYMNYLGNYRCRSWQTFVQQVINYACHGYHYFNYYEIEEKRQKSLPKIDAFIVGAYETNMSKDRRYFKKKAGLANYAYLRYEGMIVVMKTDGKGAPTDHEDDVNGSKRTIYKDFRMDYLIFHPRGGEISLKIGLKDDQITLSLTERSYRHIHQKCVDYLIHNNISKLLFTFNALNGIPPYKGVYEQKRRLKAELMRLAKKHGRKVSHKQFKITSKVKRWKVYENDA